MEDVSLICSHKSTEENEIFCLRLSNGTDTYFLCLFHHKHQEQVQPHLLRRQGHVFPWSGYVHMLKQIIIIQDEHNSLNSTFNTY